MDQQGTDYASGVHKYSFRANVESQAKKWFKIGANSSIGYDERQLSQMTQGMGGYTNTSPAFAAILWPTWDTPYDPETGEEVWYNMSGYMNPKLRNQYYKYKGNTLQLNTTGFVQFTPIENLNIKSQVGVDLGYYTSENKRLPSYPLADGTGKVSRSAENSYTITYTNTIDYQRAINDVHNIYALAGHESVMYKGQGMSGSISGQVSDKMLTFNNGTGTPTVADSFSEYTFNSAFARLEYNYNRKYNVDASVRYDESSRFGAKNRGAIFWSVGAKWDAKREVFLKDVNWLSTLSVRTSYGTQGNASIGNYAPLGLVASRSYGDEAGLNIDSVQNDELGWETQKLFTAGFSAGFWQDRLTVDFEFYNRQTVNMLMDIPYPVTSGYTSGTKNVGGMLNRGVDITVRGDVVRTKDWLVSLYANFNYNKNEITELFNGYDEYALPDYGLCYKVGHDGNEFYMESRLGVDPEDGRIIWATVDPVTGERGQTKEFSQATPELQGKSCIPPMAGGFGINAQWKGISVAADFSWAAKKYLINNDRVYAIADDMSYINRDRELLNRWEQPGDIAKWGAFGEELGYFDSNMLEDASFIRLKNLTVGYDLPRKWMAKTGFMQGLRVYFTARNLLTFTKFTGFDPEIDSNLVQPGNNYPNSRQYVGGIQLTF
jgi:TonB-linked SusC/RagA family outer membrane protein